MHLLIHEPFSVAPVIALGSGMMHMPVLKSSKYTNFTEVS